MADNRNQRNQQPEPSSSRGPLIVLIAGGIAIAALVGWALTRTVEPAAPETAVSAPIASVPPTATETPSTVPVPPPGQSPAPAQTTTSPNAGVGRITPQELKPLVDRGAVTIVDVRDSVAYSAGHIPGAVHIPFTRVEGESKYLPKDKPIVAYCT